VSGRNTTLWLTALSLLGMLLLHGCSSDNLADLRAYADQVKKRPGGRIPPLPEVKPFPSHTYAMMEYKDPFEVPKTEEEKAGRAPGTGPQPPKDHVPEALEAFPLDSLRMVGTLEQEDQLWAIVRAQDGTIYRVREGNYMGQNYGRITHISDQQMDVREIVPDTHDGYIERDQTIALSEK